MLSTAPRVWQGGTLRSLKGLAQRSTPADGPAPERELEIGFGKGRYLLERARQCPQLELFGIEIAREYWRLACDRATRRGGLDNLTLVHGEALSLLAAHLPANFARAVHIYFPDPWPKKRHRRRRLLDATSIDLIFRVLSPGGRLFFATDFLEYGEKVAATLSSYSEVDCERLSGGWPEGVARTNYEAKYITEGRPILRLMATRVRNRPVALHDQGRETTTVAWDQYPPREDIAVQ